MNQAELPEIIVFMQTEVLSGSIYISTPKTRLLDELNGGLTPVPETGSKFIGLTDINIQHVNGRQEEKVLVYVNKETIQMAATSSADTRRGFGGDPDPKPYPYIEKVPMPVEIVMMGYEIKGNMHRISHQTLEDVIVEKTTFVPLTDAEVRAIASNKRWNVPFLAVNKRQILSLYEV
jgi:hypothetical protein